MLNTKRTNTPKTRIAIQYPMMNLIKFVLVFLFGSGLLTVFIALSPAQIARAATLSVTDCTQFNGPNTLGAALASAGSGDTIQFNCSGTITPPSVINISQNLTLDGNGNIVTISGGNAHQVINVPASAVNLTITDLTIANGLNSVSGGPAVVTVLGGGISFNSTGTLTINKSNIINNSVSATNSGGAANARGGGIYNSSTGTINIFNSTIGNNSATGTSTSGNPANGQGGGIYNFLTGAVNILNSTIALNTVTGTSTGAGSGRGAGVLNLGGPLTVINSTVTANTSNSSGTGTSQGGGLQLLGGGTITLKNTIVAGNSATQGPDINVPSMVAITANSNNMIGNTNTSAGTLTGTGPSDILNPASTGLGSLSNNGGPTQTVPLLAGSPALGAGLLATCNTAPPNGPGGLDQRGATRGAASCNIGSFEGTLAIVPTKLVISTVPNSVAGANFSVTVTAEDNSGNVATSFTGAVTLALSGGSGATLQGTLTVNAVNGVATFNNLSINKVGTNYQIAATSGALTPAVSNNFNITPGAATKLIISTVPNSTAGANFSVTVTAEDNFGNTATGFTGAVTLALSGGTIGATLSGTNPVNAVAGVATFNNLSINLAGTNYQLTATSGALTQAVSNNFNITPGAATKLVISTVPNSTVGANFNVTVTAEDNSGNIDTSFTGAVTLALSSASLNGTNPVNAVAGVATFNNLSISTVGTNYQIAATSGALTQAVSNKFDITPGPAAKLIISTIPNSTAGANFNVIVTAEDSLGNTATGFTGAVTLALSGGTAGATLSGTNPVNAVNGVANFSVSVNLAGTNYQITATSGALTQAVSNNFDIAAGAAAKLVISPVPNSTAGASFSVVVTAEDSLGNVDTTYAGAVTLALGGGIAGATLSGTNPVNAVNGVATFNNLSINLAGTAYQLTATSGTLTQAVSNNFDITAGAAAKLVISTVPNSAAGANFSVVVTAEDSLGNVATGYTGAVTLALSGGTAGAILSGTNPVNAVAGITTFNNLSINLIGTAYQLTATSGALTQAVSNNFDITAGAATKLVISTVPNSTAGASFSVIVTAEDSLGNVDTTYNGAVTLALSGGTNGATLSGTNPVNAVNGVANFNNLSVNLAGTNYQLTATSGALTQAVSNTFDITAGAATKLVISTVPNSTAGATFSVVVTAEDSLGNVDTTYTGAVTLALSGGTVGAALSGTNPVNAVNGVATFNNLSINLAGTNYQLTATSGALTSAVSNNFDITAGAATKLVISTVPNSAAGANFSVVVTAEDILGNVVTSYAGAVTLALSGGTNGATLNGTNPVNAVNGVATFNNLSINLAGTNYQLTATSGALTSATSNNFDITAGTATKLIISTVPSSAGGANFSVVVTAEDSLGNVVTSYTGAVTVALSGGTAGATLSGTNPVNAVNGIATFSNLSVNLAGTNYQLTATSGALTQAISNNFDITAGTATKLVISTVPNSTAGATFSVVVTAEDSLGNVDTTYSGAVTLALSGGTAGATLSGTNPINATNGVATFNNLSINLAGTSYELTATSGALTQAVSNTFDITAGTATKLVISTVPNSTAGANFSVVVTAEDILGNVATTYNGAVTLALNGGTGGAILGGTNPVNVVNGVATFSVSINLAGTNYQLTATSGALTSATSNTFDISAGATNVQLVSSNNPSNYGQAVVFTATVGVVSGSGPLTGTVTFSDNISGTLGSANIDASGVATITVSSLTAGSHTITATYNGNTVYGGSNTSINQVVNQAATTTSLTSSPNPSTYEQSVTFTATMTSGAGTPSGTVVFTIDGVNTSPVTLSGGIATYITSTLSVGNHNVTASYQGSTNFATSTSTPTYVQQVTAGAGSVLLISTIPNVNAGSPFSVLVTVTDGFGNVATSFNNPISLTIKAGTGTSGAVLSGTTTVNAINGVATFNNLSINLAGTGYVLTATSGNLTTNSNAFNVTAGTATNITASSGTPQSTQVGTVFAQPLVATVTDSHSNPVSGTTVTFVAPSSGASGAFANGGTTINVSTNSSGVASTIITANNTAGTYNVNATVSGAATPAAFVLTNTATITNNTATLSVAPTSLTFNAAAGGFNPTVQTVVLSATNASLNWSVSINPGSATWLSVNFSSGTVAPGTPVNVLVSAATGNLAAGTYTATLTFSNNSNPNDRPKTVNVSFIVAAATVQKSYSYYLPYLANQANGFTSYLAFQDIGSATANITLQYYDVNGNPISTPAGSCSTVPQYGECLPPNPFANGSRGTGRLTSDQPLTVLISEGTPYGGSSYPVVAGANNNLVAPIALNNAYGGFTSQLTIFNTDSNSTTVTITFYNADGTLASGSHATQTLTLAAHTSTVLSQSDPTTGLAVGFNGWAQITGSGSSQLVAQVLEQNPNNHFAALANSQITPQAKLYAPAIFNNAFGGFYTGANIVNPNAQPVQVSVTYYDHNGQAYPAAPFTLAAYAIQPIYQGANSGTGIPSGGLPANFYGSATVIATNGGVMMTINEQGGTTASGASRNGTYQAVGIGGSLVGLPSVANGGLGFNSGMTILNTSSGTVTGTVQYYSLDGTPVGNPQPFSASGGTGINVFAMVAHGSYPSFAGDKALNLPANFYGTAVVTQSSGTPNSLIVTVNLQSDSVFYSYSEPSQ